MLPERSSRPPAAMRYPGLPSVRLRPERHRYHHGPEGEEIRLVLSIVIQGRRRAEPHAGEQEGDPMASEPVQSSTTEYKVFLGFSKTVTTQPWPPPVKKPPSPADA